jgi:hypothetical protein
MCREACNLALVAIMLARLSKYVPRNPERRTILEEIIHEPRKDCREKIAVASSWK